MRRVWGRASSGNVMKVIWLLEELNLHYERLDVGGAFGQTDTPEYLAKNPNRKVPTLEEDGFVLWESNAILRYISGGETTASRLWPDDRRRRAVVDQWMDWQQTAIEPFNRTVFQHLYRLPEEQRDIAQVRRAAAELNILWATLDAVLKHRPFVASDEFTLADIALGVPVHRWFAYPVERDELKWLRAWYERLLESEHYRKHVALPLS